MSYKVMEGRDCGLAQNLLVGFQETHVLGKLAYRQKI